MIDFTYTLLLSGAIVLAMSTIVLGMRKRSLWYLLFFFPFGLYLLFMISLIVFPIAPTPKEYAGIFKPHINLLPFYFGDCSLMGICLRNIVGSFKFARRHDAIRESTNR